MPQLGARPSPGLAPFVSAIGYYASPGFPHARERVLPSGGAQLLINLAADELGWHLDGEGEAQRTPGAALQGAATRPGVIDPAHQRAIVCVSLRPGGILPFLGTPGSEACNRLVPLATLWGADGATLRERLLAAGEPRAVLRMVDAILTHRAAGSPAPDPAVRVAARALHLGASVAEASDRLGWTPRRLGRRFTTQVGVTPKRFARVRRFQRLIAAVTEGGGYGREVDWARLAAACGYYDQAHLIHDFRTFAGMRPSEYRPRAPNEHNHVPLGG